VQRTIQIDDDIYEFLRQHGDFGETPSVVLRRFLQLPLQRIECPTCKKMTESEKTYSIEGKTVRRLKCGHLLRNESHAPAHAGDETVTNGVGEQKSKLMRFVADPVFVCQNPTDKYLGILGFAAMDKGDIFDRVLKVSGRRRRYIGSCEDIEKSGTSTHPRPIPNSEYWAMTNADTVNKRKMLSKTLRVLDYTAEEIQTAASVIF
jgi:negative modulator of initiation of replication